MLHLEHGIEGLSFVEQQLALAKLCYEDPNIKEKELMMGKAHYNLSVIYYEMVLILDRIKASKIPQVLITLVVDSLLK